MFANCPVAVVNVASDAAIPTKPLLTIVFLTVILVSCVVPVESIAMAAIFACEVSAFDTVRSLVVVPLLEPSMVTFEPLMARTGPFTFPTILGVVLAAGFNNTAVYEAEPEPLAFKLADAASAVFAVMETVILPVCVDR